MLLHFIEHAELPNPDIEYRGRPMTVQRLTGLLWNCTDLLPGGYCAMLGIPTGSSYARAARLVRAAHSQPTITNR